MFAVFISSISIVASRTTDCNYVIDLFQTTVNPPSLSPTPAPTPSPTLSPTNAPTNTGEDPIEPIPNDPTNSYNQWASYSFPHFFMRPYTFNYCYSYATNKEPFNSYSFIYQCNGESLQRTIYYDNLDCSGTDIEETTIQKYQQGATIIFQCSADINCDAAKISMQYASTTVRLMTLILNLYRNFC